MRPALGQVFLRVYIHSSFQRSTEHIAFFALTKPREVKRTRGT